jgi:hypothetical protein
MLVDRKLLGILIIKARHPAMSKITENTMNTNVETSSSDLSWWNRPIVGEVSMMEQLFGKGDKPEVSEEVIFLHNREMMDINVFAKTLQAIDNEKFGSEEFLEFVKIKHCLRQGIGGYQDLYTAIRLLQLAIDAKDSFISIDQTELRYRGSKQQQFYELVEKLLTSHDNAATFRDRVQEKISALLPQVKTEEGKIALQSYAKHLDRLAEHELGLQLLSLFKTYELADYSILRTISAMVDSLHKRDLRDSKALISLVIVNFEVFNKLKRIIGISDRQHTPETYAIMLQYIGLDNRYKLSFLKFEELIKVMRKWMAPYQAILGIRQHHPATEFKQPKGFKEVLPGIEIYHKYKKWLTDKKTGMSYVDFGEEVAAVTRP